MQLLRVAGRPARADGRWRRSRRRLAARCGRARPTGARRTGRRSPARRAAARGRWTGGASAAATRRRAARSGRTRRDDRAREWRLPRRSAARPRRRMRAARGSAAGSRRSTVAAHGRPIARTASTRGQRGAARRPGRPPRSRPARCGRAEVEADGPLVERLEPGERSLGTPEPEIEDAQRPVRAGDPRRRRLEPARGDGRLRLREESSSSPAYAARTARIVLAWLTSSCWSVSRAMRIASSAVVRASRCRPTCTCSAARHDSARGSRPTAPALRILGRPARR